jgi:hypothetical protein
MTKSEDNHEKLQAMQLFKDTHLVKLELLSNATATTEAKLQSTNNNEVDAVLSRN